MTVTSSEMSHEQYLPGVLMDIISDTLDRYRVAPYIELADLAGMIFEAQTGAELHVPLISGLWTRSHTEARRPLERYFGRSWSTSWPEEIARNGRRLPGVSSAELRDETGRIVHPEFIATLNETGRAVEVGHRQTADGRTVEVNRIWQLWRNSNDDWLPLARMQTIDAGVADAVRPIQTEGGGPTYYDFGQDVMVGEELVVFPGLALPTLPEA